jgi:hypothetical protein
MKSIQFVKWNNKVFPIYDGMKFIFECKNCKDIILIDELIGHIICGSEKIEKYKVFKLDDDCRHYKCFYLNTKD